MKDLYSSPATGAEAKTRPQAKKEAKQQRKYGRAYEILIKPLVTEKSANLGAYNKYVFAVAPKANKIEVAKAVAEIYGIKPVQVNIIKVKGKKVLFGRITGKRKDWKKAVVTLPAGQSINVYEGV